MASEVCWRSEGDPRKDAERDLKLRRPCACGCDRREGGWGVGYLTGATGGLGFTLWIKNEELYRAVRLKFLAMGLEAGE